MISAALIMRLRQQATAMLKLLDALREAHESSVSVKPDVLLNSITAAISESASAIMLGTHELKKSLSEQPPPRPSMMDSAFGRLAPKLVPADDDVDTI